MQKQIIYGENYIHGQMHQVHVQLDGTYQVMLIGKLWKLLWIDELIVEMLQIDGYVIDLVGSQMYLIIQIEN